MTRRLTETHAVPPGPASTARTSARTAGGLPGAGGPGPAVRPHARVIGDPALAAQLARLRGCQSPVRIAGQRLEVAAAPSVMTGPGGAVFETVREVVSEFRSEDLPAGCLLIPCGNRRATRCAACAEVYRRDMYQLINAGLAGGKGVPESIGGHPRVFLTLTAPSFGPVHNRLGARTCSCGTRHDVDDPALGTPVRPESYDYAGAVLWNNHASKLWARFATYLRRELAAAAGMTHREVRSVARVSFAKVAEYQKRGAIHFHAVIRIDGPDDHAPPPSWANVRLLDTAIRAAHARTELPAAEGSDQAEALRWGAQFDIRPIRSRDLDAGTALTDRAVAGYIAKYATKGAESTGIGTADRRLHSLRDLDAHKVTDHARRLITTAWELGARPELADLELRRWAHMLGFRGHFSTKSRAYSTTLGALRAARAAWRADLARAAAQAAGEHVPPPDTVFVIGEWAYIASGLTAVEVAVLAAGLLPDRPT